MKLVLAEPESDALAAHVAGIDAALASSSLVRVELSRAVTLANNPAAIDDLRDLLAHLVYVAVDDAVLARAALLASDRLRSLDAIHLASALTVGAQQMLVYDARLAEAAEAAGIEVVAPAP